ncbi:MAG: ArsA family ATPase [Deltaproteobacteria bacterium]|nr:ArsA family ATPase [Deltaproteobacteria bacterium]MBI3390594.1 ArsA family ATPase [Deltaproteobacteria bacterium]
MPATQLLFVIGKGGVGKTTVAAALARGAAQRGGRVLVVETASDGRLAALFGVDGLGSEPQRLATRIAAVRIDSRQLVEAYFTRLLRVPLLARRLLASTSFNALTAAAPGVTEFLILERLLGWVEPSGLLARRAYDVVIVDGPATGHALALLRTPRNLASMVPGGPIGTTARRLLALLGDGARTRVVLVTIPEELAINETLEAHAVLVGDLALRVERPVLNRVFPRGFSRADVVTLSATPDDATAGEGPLLAAARFRIAARRDAERHAGRLRRALGATPIVLPQICTATLAAPQLDLPARRLCNVLLSS